MPAKKTTKKVTKKSTIEKSPPSHNEIAKVAFEIYVRRKNLGHPGDSESDWAEAVRSLS